MNHYAARVMLDKDGNKTGLFRYTMHNDRTGTYAVGHCADDCPGHATEDEACEHYKQYLLSRAIFRGPKTQAWPKDKCQTDGCELEATHMASISGTIGHVYQFCEAHCNRDELAKKMRVGWSYSS